MSAPKNEIIPFGKYKGQPIEVLQQDRGYCDWLVGQDWLQTRFPELRTIIVNNFAEPTETPEHNALQARALDCMFISGILYLTHKDLKRKHHGEIYRQLNTVFESRGMDVVVSRSDDITVTITKEDEPLFSELKRKRIDNLKRRIENTWRDEERKEIEKSIEETNGAASLKSIVSISVLGVELKPTLGDEYPAAIRQIRASKFWGYGIPVIIVGQYTGAGATLDQVRQMFEASGIRFLLVSEIEAMAATLP